MLVPFAHNQIELALGKLWIDQRERNAVKGQVPRCVPGKFPFIGHRHHPLVVEMPPLGVATVQALWRRWWLARIAFEPLLDDVMIKLLVPKHPGEGLPLNRTMLLAQTGRRELA